MGFEVAATAASSARDGAGHRKEERHEWVKPAFDEIKMDAEAKSYSARVSRVAAGWRAEHEGPRARLGAGGGCPQWNCAAATVEARETDPSRSSPGPGVRGSQRRRRGVVPPQRFPEIRARSTDSRPSIRNGCAILPIEGILLSNGDLDHTLGLLCLRESHPLVVYATEPVRRGFVEHNVLYRTLQRFPAR